MLRIRLSVIMFLHYFAAGASLPLMSLYFSQELGFGGAGAGFILSISALAAFITPLIGSFVADRLISAERLFAVTELAGALAVLLLALQRSFIPVLIFYLLYMSLFIPATALSNIIVFHHSPDQGRSYGGIRLWGTVGWVFSGWIFSFAYLRLFDGAITDALFATSLIMTILGLYALTLPKGGKRGPRRNEFIPRAALAVIAKPQVFIVFVLGLLMQITHRFYYFGAAPYLRYLGFEDSMILPAMSLGQTMEIVSMLCLPFLFRFFAYRTILVFGVAMEFIRFLLFFVGSTSATALAGIAFHGPSFTFFFTVAFIYLNSFTNEESRAGVQQLFMMVIDGGGTLAGSLLAGHAYDRAVFAALATDYQRFWIYPLAITIPVLIFVLLLRFLPRGRYSEG
jgi:MFS family permease